MCQLFGVIHFHVRRKGRQLGIVCRRERVDQHLGRFARIGTANDMGRAVFVMRQQFIAIRQIDRAAARERDLGLFGRDPLAHDAGVEPFRAGPGAFSIAHNLESEAAVDEAFAHAIACGATATKKPEKVFWGGYSGYFADPDGHLWELAYNPFAPLDENGHMTLPE